MTSADEFLYGRTSSDSKEDQPIEQMGIDKVETTNLTHPVNGSFFVSQNGLAENLFDSGVELHESDDARLRANPLFEIDSDCGGNT